MKRVDIKGSFTDGSFMAQSPRPSENWKGNLSDLSETTGGWVFEFPSICAHKHDNKTKVKTGPHVQFLQTQSVLSDGHVPEHHCGPDASSPPQWVLPVLSLDILLLITRKPVLETGCQGFELLNSRTDPVNAPVTYACGEYQTGHLWGCGDDHGSQR